jgi:flavodoxin
MSKKVLIVYGSTTWNNQAIAEWIEEILEENWYEIQIWTWSDFSADEILNNDFSFIWSSTWWDWDIQDDMTEFDENLWNLDLKWKKLSVFSNWMSSFPAFCKSWDILKESAERAWAEVIWEIIKIDWDVYEEMEYIKKWALKNIKSI